MRFSEQASPFGHRLLVVADRLRMAALLEQRYPTVRLAVVPTYMAGIAELANGPVHAVLACVDPTFASLERAIRGLRMAIGESTPLVLCCPPECEPMSRRALEAGADDYLIFPPDPRELDQLLSLQPSAGALVTQPPATNVQEMVALARVLESLTQSPHRLLQQMAELLAGALGAGWVQVLADGLSGLHGVRSGEPVLQEAIIREGQKIGEVQLGLPQRGSYDGGQVDKLRYLAGICGHVLHAAKRQHQWQQLAMTDDLTRLPNRRYLMNFLNRTIQRAARERFRVTICLFDIDDFKIYNDQFSHDAGDEILRHTAQLLLRHCRVEDVVARLGGDEFVVVFWDAESPRVSGSNHPEEAIAVMKRFTEALKNHEFGCLGPKARGRLTVSGGLASFPWDAADPQELLLKADQALRQAKEHGKSRFQLVGQLPDSPA
ncbi:MAG: hypothetical protein HJJLKODD_02346 [Phycisphaerae bacterium]|nr:hypothetical protein [Phycisphaerae bacterium]